MEITSLIRSKTGEKPDRKNVLTLAANEEYLIQWISSEETKLATRVRIQDETVYILLCTNALE